MIHVQLIDSMGDDLAIVNAARVSLARHSQGIQRCTRCNYESPERLNTWSADTCGYPVVGGPSYHPYDNIETRPTAADVGLINYLMRERHGTPFEMVQFKYRVTVPIFIAREWQRHRIGSYNEQSTRYIEPALYAYLPPTEDMRTQVGKPGRYEFNALGDAVAAHSQEIMQDSYGEAYHAYERLIALGLAKEVARNVLPLAHMTEFIWSVNLRSLFNFLSLRMAPTALKEIRDAAQQVLIQSTIVTPEAFKAWGTNGRPTP